MVTIYQNEDYTKYLHLQYADTADPVNLTECSVYSQMRTEPNGTLLATATCTTAPLNGDIWVKYSASDMLALEPQECGFDVWIVDGMGFNHPIYTTRCKIAGRYTENLGG